ncbi:MAG TPA: hypothetical protein VJ917_10710 [Saprospiraceae bacterium]|nr:hypothetical protein [Saprospiraceae bacterium]
MKTEKKHHQQLPLAVILALTLGLAPFYPEPHLFGKIRWITGGAQGMQMMDYFDLILHGAPWIYLIAVLVLVVKSYFTTSQ